MSHPNSSLITATAIRSPKDCRHLSQRGPGSVCLCLCFTGVQSPVFSPNENPAAEAVKPSTRYLLFKSFLTSLSACARPFMPLPLLSVIKANLNPLIISPEKTIFKLLWSGFEEACVPCKTYFISSLVATQANRASYFIGN